MKIHGLDEAALGPRLGPFCACLIKFQSTEDHPFSVSLYEVLKAATAAEPSSSAGIIIADSKKIYQPSRGIAALEHSIGIFLEIAGAGFPHSLESLVRSLCPPEDCALLAACPWFEEAAETVLPLSNLNLEHVAEQADVMRQCLLENRISFQRPAMRFITAAKFNELLIENKNKSIAVRTILYPLLEESLNTDEEGRLAVDRQGGRRYYFPWLRELFPGMPLEILSEEARRSAYLAGKTRIEFLVAADALHLETALASMFAKYLREAAMYEFNRWWMRRVSNLRPTAGYPQDAERFIACLRAAEQFPQNADILVRRL
ncbi:MAG: hypothetical protein B0D92_07475 [Spirochaeta sp. LUC14_002_19_P3]|nr:MAG: hypothetical protein B0D92_07475 [Spirochaeta sp. LUC14_002_19_P3]